MRDSQELAAHVGKARDHIWGRFMDPNTSILYDHTDAVGTVHLPTEDDIRLHKPNALSYQVPIEDGAFYNSLLLIGTVARWQDTADPAAAADARAIAATLERLGTVSPVPGFVARNVLSSSEAYYPCSSDDQVFPWALALWVYLRSDLPGEEEAGRLAALLMSKIEALYERSWEIPSDPTSFGHYGSFFAARSHHAVRVPFLTRIAHEMSGETVWLDRYRESLAVTPPGRDAPTITLLERGVAYGPPGANPHRFWLSGSSQPALSILADLEDDPQVAEQFRRGLRANARNAVPHLELYSGFENSDDRYFELDWHYLNSRWRPQTDAWDARQLAMEQVEWGYEVSPRGPYEFSLMTEPLFAAWVIVASNDADFIRSQASLLEAAILHYDWSRLYTVPFVIVEAVFHGGRRAGLWNGAVPAALEAGLVSRD